MKLRLTAVAALVALAAGRHNVLNASAAMACAYAAGAPLDVAARALSEFEAVKGRLKIHKLPAGRTLVDDTYNANPDSVRAAIDVLVSLTAPTALILGDMAEVGEQGPQMHIEVGQYAQQCGVDYLWAMGEATKDSVAAFGANAKWFESPEAICQQIDSVQPMSLLVKGSRFMAMEQVVERCLETASITRTTEEASHAS